MDKKIFAFRFFLLITILLAATFLVSLGALKVMAADYFPLQVGHSWTYSPSYGNQATELIPS